jgi:hypothetical protein
LKIGFLVAFVLLFASVTAAYQITLAWDANTESDLEGYLLYGREWSPCPPYDYIATYPVTELANPLNPRCKVTDMEKDVIYYFVVTAYDTEGNESDFSNIVSSKGNSVNCRVLFPEAPLNRIGINLYEIPRPPDIINFQNCTTSPLFFQAS